MKIVIDGNIGAGKSTQLYRLQDEGFKVKREPIDKWPLELFYSDPERWGFMFQIIILQTLGHEDGINIYERCPMTSKEVFWKLMKKTKLEDETYRKAYELQGWSPDVYILINTPPEICIQRLNNRQQDGDNMVSLEYLKQLYDEYNIMYDNMDCTKYKIDGSKNQNDILKKIKQLIYNHDT